MALFDATQFPIPTGPEDLPFHFNLPGIQDGKVYLDIVQKCHLPEINDMWHDVSARGDGYGEGENINFIEEKIVNQRDPNYTGHVLINAQTSEVMAANFFFPSPLCRSEQPVHAAGFMLVKPKYRGKRIANYMMTLFFPFASDIYHGFLGRVTVVGKNIRPNIVSISMTWFCDLMTRTEVNILTNKLNNITTCEGSLEKKY